MEDPLKTYTVILSGRAQLMTVQVNADTEPKIDGPYVHVGSAQFLRARVLGWGATENVVSLLSHASGKG